jgi:hypothetical protein
MGFGYDIVTMKLETNNGDKYSFKIEKYLSFISEGYMLGLLVIYLVLCSYYYNKLCTLEEK